MEAPEVQTFLSCLAHERKVVTSTQAGALRLADPVPAGAPAGAATVGSAIVAQAPAAASDALERK